jgi:aminomuconate-semialdehyde/2-hydroxymuconate-6-semialdehyde dehydrogenase
LIEERLEEFAEAESKDQGKPFWLARQLDIPRAIDNFRFFAGQILYDHEATYAGGDGKSLNYVERRPLGVAGLISPWNLPLYLLTWKIAPALAFGNTAVCKPSELTPLTASMLGQIFSAAGLPPGVCNIVLGTGPKVGAPLTMHPDVPLISFTGGTTTGQTIATATAPMFKKLSLELGGKNANIIFGDADLDRCVATTLRSSFLNQGEICLCGSRIFVEETIYESFLDKFITAAKVLKVGDPKQSEHFLGAIVSREHQEKISSYCHLARRLKGKIQLGGIAPEVPPPHDRGYFWSPTIITDLDDQCPVMQEEIFGPVVTVSPFRTETELIERVNGVRYGLSATLWTSELSRAHHVASMLDVGQVWINTWMMRDLRVPFGGVKDSGLGREGGVYSRDFYTEAKNICLSLA